MNIIIVGKRHGQSKTYSLGPVVRFLLLGSLCILPFAMGAAGYLLAAHLADQGLLDPVAAKAWEKNLDDQRQELQEIRLHADQELDGLTLRLAELQAKLLRIDALGACSYKQLTLPKNRRSRIHADCVSTRKTQT